jgi:two-component system invasion response regulator UvrY
VIRVAIVDDHPMARAGLRLLLAAQEDLEVVAEAADGRGAVDMIRRERVDVLVLDLSMPDIGGFEVLAEMKSAAPCLQILVLSGFPAEQHVMQVLREGGNGYLRKDCDPNEIAKAIRLLHGGQRYMSPDIEHRVATGLLRSDKFPHEFLSAREYDVFMRLASGGSIKALAESMALSPKTVTTYRARVMEKMALSSNSDLTHYAVIRGLL